MLHAQAVVPPRDSVGGPCDGKKMDGFVVVLAVLMLLVGACLGAASVVFAGRRRSAEQQRQLRDLGERLAAVSADLAAADAERRLLASQNAQLSSLDEQENTVLRALGPVAEKLSLVQTQVALLERDRVEQFGQLSQQLKEARLNDEQLLRSTQTLSAALQSNSARGQWGEVQLRRVVEAAGMLPHVDFVEQVHSAGSEGTLRPDMVVRLPGKKQLVVDAKVPLGSYLQAQDLPADSGPSTRRGELLGAHAKALKAHVDALAGKKYWEASANAPELVICFLPAESILSAALQADPTLLDHALARNVALASPVSLLATLKSVAFAWRQDVLTDNARELFQLAQQLYARMGTLGEAAGKLGASLKTTVDRYNAVVGTLEGRILPTARKLNALDENALATPPMVEAVPRSLSAPELLQEDDGEPRRDVA